MENRFKKIVKDIFSFAQFVSEAENEIPNQSSRYYDCWWELEVLNASALEDWETSGKPENRSNGQKNIRLKRYSQSRIYLPKKFLKII